MTTPPAPPVSLALLIEHLGLADTLRLIEAYGGTKLWIPTGLSNSHVEYRLKLEEEFGAPMVRALIRGYGGGNVFVPLCRDWRIELYFHRGMSQMAIAKKVGCHYATVERHLALGRRETRQAAWNF